jgi:hypothetical protein
MGIRRPVCEGASLTRKAPACVGTVTAGASVDRMESSKAVAKRRAEALRAFFPKLSSWLHNRAHFARMREVERYLAEATDLAELEHRIAQIERAARRH